MCAREFGRMDLMALCAQLEERLGGPRAPQDAKKSARKYRPHVNLTRIAVPSTWLQKVLFAARRGGPVLKRLARVLGHGFRRTRHRVSATAGDLRSISLRQGDASFPTGCADEVVLGTS